MSDLAHALPMGTRIAGYEITGCLGQGGFGITYTAFNRVTDRQVAIKEFFPQSVASRSATSTELLVYDGQEETLNWALRKFEATTSDLCRLTHPNIVGVIDYYPGNRTGYMVMEYLSGLTLEDWLEQRREPPRPSELAALLDPVLDALEYLHSLGLVHRDIAPDNIFVCEDNRPVLIDFGASSHDRSAPGASGRSTVVVKKRSFTAPDQARGLSLPNPTADVYSFGAVLYQALSGTAPVDGEERMIETLLGRDPYRSLEAEPPAGTSRTMGRAVDKCLSLDPSMRPQSIRAARNMFDWRDDDGRQAADHARFEEALDAPDMRVFSLEHDVISLTSLDELELPQAPPRQLVAEPEPLKTQTTPKTRLFTRPRLALLAAVLIVVLIGFLLYARLVQGR